MLGQRLQKQIGQTGIPVYNVANACATGATAVRTGIWPSRRARPTWPSPSASEQMGKMGLLGRRRRGRGPRPRATSPSGRYGSVMPVEGILGTQLMPGVFAQAGMEYASQHDGVGFEQFAKVAEKNHAHSSLNPLAQYQQGVQPRGGHGGAHGRLPEHPAHVLPHRRRGGRGGAVLGRQAPDPRPRRAAPGREDLGVGAHLRPYVESDTAQPDVNTLTTQRGRPAYEQAGVGPEDLDLVELHDCFATAELIHYENLQLCEPGGAGDFIDRRGPVARRDHARSTCRAV